ncbi:hypothetical protein NVP1022O_78 [Vibrio phage 1.022.O._10N.286.45.A10]|nr:hypothetical protein NVP1022O_78 [Vibrio phage 1.022.O._10N.286.45.A10]
MSKRPCSECGKRPAMLYRFRCGTCEGATSSQVLKLRTYQQKTIDDLPLIEVGKKDKRKVSPLNKELYDFASYTLYESADNKKGHPWHVGSEDIGNFIDELEKRYDITPKTDGDNV